MKSLKKLLAFVAMLSILILLTLSMTGFRWEDDLNTYNDFNRGGGGGEVDVEPTDVIKNGGFELRDPDVEKGIAQYWGRYSNGRAHFGWYDDTWNEVVYEGEHAQLMEIKEIYANDFDRIIAIYQTIENLVPNATYDLTLYAMMRSDARIEFRNNNDYEMSWGIDQLGQESISSIDTWHVMPLTEQSHLGSANPNEDDDEPLFYEMITGTIITTDTDTVTLYIRGVKRYPFETEILFDVDNVSLVGPRPSASTASTTETTETVEANLPDSGATLPRQITPGSVILGGIVLVLLGASAAVSVLFRKR